MEMTAFFGFQKSNFGDKTSNSSDYSNGQSADDSDVNNIYNYSHCV